MIPDGRCRQTETGFALVELMVVVLIIGILVAIAVPVFNAAREVAQERACQANLRTIEGAVQHYLAGTPANAPADCDGVAWVGVLVGPNRYIVFEPTCPTVGAHYTYDAATGTAACTNPAADGGPHSNF